MQHAYITGGPAGRVGLEVGIHRKSAHIIDERIVCGIENLFTVGIGDTDIVHHILETVFHTWREIGYGEPEFLPVGRLVHLCGRVLRPAVEFTDEEGPCLSGRMQHQCYRRIAGEVVDTVPGSGGKRQDGGLKQAGIQANKQKQENPSGELFHKQFL